MQRAEASSMQQAAACSKQSVYKFVIHIYKPCSITPLWLLLIDECSLCLLHAFACWTPCLGASNFDKLTLVGHFLFFAFDIIGTIGLRRQGYKPATSYSEFILKCNLIYAKCNLSQTFEFAGRALVFNSRCCCKPRLPSLFP